MFCKWLTALLLLGFCSVIADAQKIDAPKTPKAAEQKELEIQIRNQAVFLLRDNLSRAKSISVLRQRAYVIIEASMVLWDFDRPVAEEALVGFINQSLADYKDLSAKEKRNNDEKNELEDLRDGIRQALKAITRKDPKGAILLREKYFKIREDVVKTKSLSEEMELAAEGLDADEQRTVNLLNSIIQQGIPREFPRLINTLKTSKPAVADSLIQRAIQNVAGNPKYKSSDAINVSGVIFNENQFPIPILDDPTTPNQWGTLTNNSLQIKDPPSRDVILSYYSAVQGFFNSRVLERSAGIFDSNQNLLQACYLIEKLRAYSGVYNVPNPEMLDRSLIPVVDAMGTAGFTDPMLKEIKSIAYLQATKNNPFDVDDGTRCFEKADGAKTPEEKMQYLIEGIVASTQTGQFAKAELKIVDVDNAEVRDALYLYLGMRAGLSALEKGNWSEFDKRTEKITDKKIRAFLYVKATSVLGPRKNSRVLLTEYVNKAEKDINFIPDKNGKASARAALTSLLLTFEDTETIRDVPSAIASINDAPEWDEFPFTITVIIPAQRRDHGVYNYTEYTGEGSFKNVFARLAESDWTNAQVQALQIKRGGLQAIAQISAAKAVLRKISQ